MANDWDPNLWNPTSREHLKSVSKQEFYAISTKIQHLTRSINKSPYDPGIWMLRAVKLVNLGYFELAAGDMYKASLLLEGEDAIIPGGNIKITGEIWDSEELFLFRIDVYRKLINTLVLMRDLWGSQEICEKAMKMSTSESPLGKAMQTAWDRLAAMQEERKRAKNQSKTGAALFSAYPFQPYEYLVRKKELIQSTQEAFKIVSPNCELLPSPLSSQSAMISDNNNSLPSPSDNFYGVFATKNIAQGEFILEDITTLGAANINPIGSRMFQGIEICSNCYCTIPVRSTEKVSSGCCSAIYCSEHCKTLALTFYHKVLCQQNFQWLLDKPQDNSIVGLMWLRTLAISVQTDCHPLDHPLIARLTPQYEGYQPNAWSLKSNLIQPIRILLQLGIDVFRDSRFDTWVLQAVRARLVNNWYNCGKDDGTKVGIASLYSFFNHSCEPNAEDITKKSPSTNSDGTSRIVTARRAIRKGEEIFISYVDLELKTQERRFKLHYWFGGHDCSCPRCQRGD